MSARAATRGRTAASAVILCFSTLSAFGWGLEGHRIIAGAAADRMPEPLRAYFQTWREEVIEQSLVPDTINKGRDPRERIKHYVNIEDLESDPFTSLPADAGEAERRFGKKRLEKAGLLPWAIQSALGDLERAFAGGDAAEIAVRAGFLAHYAADAHQPLHLTKNYDGRATCNTGIHTAFERFLVERNAARYRKGVAKGAAAVHALEDPFGATIGWMRETYPVAADLLKADKAAMHAVKTGGSDYYRSLDRGAGAIAQSRMSAAANAIGSLWLTAWERAGRPVPPSSLPEASSAKPSEPAGGASARRPRGGSGAAPR